MTDLLRRQYDEMVSENARLQALLAERDAEVARLREAGDAMAEAVEHEANERTRSGRVIWQRGYDALAVWSAARAALAARGGEGQG